jgi:hypothetical protein
MDLRAPFEYVLFRVLDFLDEIPVARRPRAASNHYALCPPGHGWFSYFIEDPLRPFLYTDLYVYDNGFIVTKHMDGDACLWRASHASLSDALATFFALAYPPYREKIGALGALHTGAESCE